MSSLCVAHALKAKRPDLMIAMGGYAVHGDVGKQLLRCFSEIDVIVQGDGEVAIDDLAHASVGGMALQDVANTLVRHGTQVIFTFSTTPLRMDDIPAPDYDDFLLDVKRLKEEQDIAIEVGAIPLEFSRGCWWGAKHHCVFCGIDDDTMKY